MRHTYLYEELAGGIGQALCGSRLPETVWDVCEQDHHNKCIQTLNATHVQVDVVNTCVQHYARTNVERRQSVKHCCTP